MNLIKPNKNKIMNSLLSYNKNKLKKKFFFFSKKAKINYRNIHATILNTKIKKIKNNNTHYSKALMREFTNKYIKPIKIPFYKKHFF